MNQAKRVAVMQNIHQACASQKREVPRYMHAMKGAQLRRIARSFGILRKRKSWTPLGDAERAAVWAKARHEAAGGR